MRRVWRAYCYLASESESPFSLSPTDALISLVIGCRLRCQIPTGLHVHPLIRLCISVIPKRWPARRGYARELGVHPDVIENPPDLRAFGNKPDQAHLPTAHWS